MRTDSRPGRILLLTFLSASLPAVAAQETNPPYSAAMLKALQPLHGLVGTWQGEGASMRSSGWQEEVDVLWGFRERDGRVSLNFYFEGGELLDVGLLTYGPATKKYTFVAKTAKGAIIRFVGEPDGSSSLRLVRDEKTSDKLDRLDIRLLRGGDKMLLRFGTQKGRSSFYDNFAQIELFRQGVPLVEFADGPHCVVTGGAGRVAVEHDGKSYPVACGNTKEFFLAHPDLFAK